MDGNVPHQGRTTVKVLYDYPVFLQAGKYTGVDIRDDVSYNLADKEGLRAYEQSERFRKSGLTKTQLSALIQKAIQNIPAQQVYEKTIQPVYTVKENSIFSTIHTTGIPPHVYPIAQKVYEAHKTNGTLDALMASYTGTKNKAVTNKVARTDAVPFAPADIVNAHTEVVSPSPSVTQTSPVFTAVDSTRQTPAPSPTLSAADKEKLRMARINANYEHDKKLLAKEDPAFVRSPFHNIGHAQGNEELSERDLYKIARELNEEKKEKLRNGR